MHVLENIHVVPDYPSNYDLTRSIREKLEEYVDVTSYNGAKPPPKIIIFRPTGRPADEFGEAVTPLLNESSDSFVYLIVAFSGQLKDITELVPYNHSDRVRITEAIFIQTGHLVPEHSQNSALNRKAFERIARAICKDYHLPTRCPQKTLTVGKGGQAESKTRKFHMPKRPDFLRRKSTDSASTGRTQSTASGIDLSSFDIIPDSRQYLGTAVRIIEDFPQGIPQDDLCRLMNLQDNDRADLLATLDREKSVFAFHVKSGQKYIKFNGTFEAQLASIKGKGEYRHCLERHKGVDVSSQRLKDLQLKGDLDPDILSSIDSQFQLNGSLPAILNMAFELFLGDSRQEMRDKEPDEVSNRLPECTGGSDNSDTTGNGRGGTDSSPMMVDSAHDENKATEISLGDVCTFMGQYGECPDILDRELVSLIEQVFAIPSGQLIQRLQDMCKDLSERQNLNQNVPDASVRAPVVNCDTFLAAMGFSTPRLDEGLKTAIERVFEMSIDDFIASLQSVVARIREMLAA